MYFLEYSLSQKAFHRSTLQELVKNNIGTIRKSKSDYVVIGAFETLEECTQFSDMFRKVAEPQLELSESAVKDLVKRAMVHSKS